MITDDQKAIILATVPILRENGVLLTRHFYQRMFNHNPELKNVFNMGNQQNNRQQTSLAMAILAYAENIENPAVLMHALDGIGQKHISLDIRTEHYQIVGKHLLSSISEVLGDAATQEVLDAWEVAYNQLASIMSGHEQKLYSKQVQKNGGWTGWRPFIIKERIIESSEITSFHLYPADRGPVADFVPGQYISVRLFIPELDLLQPRQYSISNAPNGQYYRISVKKERSLNLNPDGIISNRLHDFVNIGDVIEVSAPSGNFILNMDNENPVVFISGGVGQTPLISMLENLMNSGSKKQKTWIHGCRNQDVHAFKEMVESWEVNDQAFQKHIFYSDVNGDIDSANLYQGWVNLSLLADDVLPTNAEYYICGPGAFITSHYNELLKKGVSKTSIHYEEFGPLTLAL